MTSEKDLKDYVQIAELKSAYGIKGWLWLYSYTDPMAAFFDYKPLLKKTKNGFSTIEIDSWKKHGKGLVVKLANVNDRNDAESLIGTQIWLHRDHLLKLSVDEFYWTDLVGLKVVNKESVCLGAIKQFFETNAHQIMEVVATPESVDAEQRLIPYHDSTVVEIDLEKSLIVVDWQSDY